MNDYGSFRWCFLVNMALGFNLSPVESIVGHDPQKLLPDLRGTARHFAAAYREIATNRGNRHWYWPDPIFPGDEITMMPLREPTFEHKAAFIRVDQVDWSHIELRVLANDPRIRCIILDIDEPGVDLPGGYGFSAMLKRDALRTKKARAKPQPSYLKHDPSKRHKGRKRK